MATRVDNWKSYKHKIDKNIRCVAKFSAQWCGPCKKISPFYKKLASDYPDIKFLEIDIDSAEKLAEKVHISSVPTFLIYYNGGLIGTIKGADQASLKKAVEDLANIDESSSIDDLSGSVSSSDEFGSNSGPPVNLMLGKNESIKHKRRR